MSHGGLDYYCYSLQSNVHHPVFSLHYHFGHKQINFLVIINQLVIMIDVMQPRWPSPDGRLHAVLTDLSVITQIFKKNKKQKKLYYYYKRRFPTSISRFEPTFICHVLYTGVTDDQRQPVSNTTDLKCRRSYFSLNNSRHTDIFFNFILWYPSF